MKMNVTFDSNSSEELLEAIEIIKAMINFRSFKLVEIEKEKIVIIEEERPEDNILPHSDKSLFTPSTPFNEIDSEGVKWNEKIHRESMKKTSKGAWFKKRRGNEEPLTREIEIVKNYADSEITTPIQPNVYNQISNIIRDMTAKNLVDDDWVGKLCNYFKPGIEKLADLRNDEKALIEILKHLQKITND